MKKNIQKSAARKGFSLVEVIIALAVIVLSVFGASSVLVTVIRSNADNVSTLVAYGLAQEGAEVVRAVRDSNWLLGANFQGEIVHASVPSDLPWGVAFPEEGAAGKYVIERNESIVPALPGQAVNAADLRNYVPWKMTELEGECSDPRTCDDTAIYKQYQADSSGRQVFRGYGGRGSTASAFSAGSSTSGDSSTPAMFHRWVEVEPLAYAVIPRGPSVNGKKYHLTSNVAWSSYGRDHLIKVETELTNWKEGQL